MSCAYDVVDLLPLLVIVMCSGPRTYEVTEMPPFKPNEYLFSTHKDKGEERWEIYAWAIRDAMSKASGMPTSDQPIREKLNFQNEIDA